jgi:hypothetical protein
LRRKILPSITARILFRNRSSTVYAAGLHMGYPGLAEEKNILRDRESGDPLRHVERS